jgi:hypothetical protein
MLSPGTRIAEVVPRSLSAFVVEAVEASCSFYEDELNRGSPFSGAGGRWPEYALCLLVDAPASQAAGGISVNDRAPLTFGEAVAARPAPARPRISPSCRPKLPLAVIARAGATWQGVMEISRGTRIADRAPRSRSAFVLEALEASCSFYEDELNGSNPFARGDIQARPRPAAVARLSGRPYLLLDALARAPQGLSTRRLADLLGEDLDRRVALTRLGQELHRHEAAGRVSRNGWTAGGQRRPPSQVWCITTAGVERLLAVRHAAAPRSD